MHKITKQSIAFLLIAAVIFIPYGTSALAESKTINEDISAEAMVADLLLVRPLGFVAYIVGCAIFVVSLPFSALGGNAGEAGQKLVDDPLEFTFKRPLGDF